MRVPSESGAAWAALPDLEFVELPGQVKDFVMYGPDWSHALQQLRPEAEPSGSLVGAA